MNLLTITPFSSGNTVLVSQRTFTIMQDILNVINGLSTPNFISTSQLYQQLDLQIVQLGLDDIVNPLSLLVTYKFVKYCPLTSTYQARLGALPLSQVFTIVT